MEIRIDEHRDDSDKRKKVDRKLINLRREIRFDLFNNFSYAQGTFSPEKLHEMLMTTIQKLEKYDAEK